MRGARLTFSFPPLVSARAQMSTKIPNKKTHYETLEINRTATQNQIKSAYFKLSKQYHPDVNDTTEAQQKFCDISEAYETLGNFDSRKKYDRSLQFRSIPGATDSSKYSGDPRQHIRRKATVTKDIRKQEQSAMYDFDAWTKAHYGRKFNKQTTVKQDDSIKRECKDKSFERVLQFVDHYHPSMLWAVPVILVGFLVIKMALSAFNVSEERLIEINARQKSLQIDKGQQDAAVQTATTR